MLGLFGGKNHPQQALMDIPESRRAPQIPMRSKLDILGGMAMDLDWTTGGGHANAARTRSDADALKLINNIARQSEIQGLLAMTRGEKNPALLAAAQANTPAYAKALIDRNLGIHQITGGNSVYNPSTGTYNQAPENFQHGNLVGTVGNGGGSTYDMGPSQKDMNDTLGHQVDMRGQDNQFNIAQMNDVTTRRGQDVSRYGHDVRAVGNQMGYDADIAKVEADLYKANNPNTAPKTFNGEQSKSAGFASRMNIANAALARAVERGHDPTKIPFIGKGARFRSDAARQYDAAQDAWIEAHLRKDSGAAIGKQERKDALATYFPRLNDSPEVVKLKASLRKQAEHSNIAQSQGAYESMFGQVLGYQSGALSIGKVEDGYEYIGGDPSSPASWRRR